MIRTANVFVKGIFTLAIAQAAACSGAEPGAEVDASAVAKVDQAIQLGADGIHRPLDYTFCADENGICSGGDRYVAFGAGSSFFFKAVSGNVECNIATFGDPLSGVVKQCFSAPYALWLAENSPNFYADSFGKEIAYGANGKFNFKTVGSQWTCDNATFGDPISNVVKACYLPLPRYGSVIPEGGTVPGRYNDSVAFGAQGNFLYKILSESATCDVATFGGDPVQGVVKTCRRLSSSSKPDSTFVADEGWSALFAGSWQILYGSGLNGEFISKVFTNSLSCNSASFGGDPHPGVFKHCWHLLIIP